MGYKLKGNKWTPKISKKMEEESSSKGKEPVGSKMPEFEGFEGEMRSFMAQMFDSMQKLHTKVDNVAILLLYV